MQEVLEELFGALILVWLVRENYKNLEDELSKKGVKFMLELRILNFDKKQKSHFW